MSRASTTRRPALIFVLGTLFLAGCGNSSGSVSVAPNTASTQLAQTTVVAPATQTTAMPPTQAPMVTQQATMMASMLTAQPSVVTQSETAVVTPQPPTIVATQSAETVIASTESALAPETNPAGDIPDSQAFVKYQSSDGGYVLDTPEGWGRTNKGGDVGFIDKYDGVSVTVMPAAAAPTAGSAQTNEVVALKQSGRAVEVTSIKDVQLPGGAALLVVYTSNSEPNPVTNKQVRLENNSYLFYKNGKLATLRLWAPLGADNVDQWTRMAQSFRWR